MKLIHKITMNTLIKTALLFLTTLTFIACSSSGGDSPPAEPPAILPKISIADATGSEGGTINFKVTSDITATVPINFRPRIEYQTASRNDLDLTVENTEIPHIAIGQNSTTISVPIKDDKINEPAETFTITLTNPSPSGTTITRATATGTIAISDSVDGIKTKLSISKNAQASEGESINFKVTSAQAIAEQISFDYRIEFDSTQTLNSASTDDLSGNLTGTMQANIATNDTSTTISIATVNDTLREEAESFSIIFSNVNPTDATFGVDNIERGRIIDNDNNTTGIVIISVADATANEASSEIVFRVSSKFPAVTGSQFTFDYEATLDIGNQDNSADANDFDATNGMATISAGQNSTTISIPITTDNTVEENETFRLLLTNPSPNVILANNSAKGTILNDDVSNVSGATATLLGNTAITLSWINPDSNFFAGVTIAQTTGSTAPAAKCTANVVATITNISTTSYTIGNLTNGETYSFRICARSNSSISSGVELVDITIREADNDGDGLIEITKAIDLYNIRHDLTGMSYQTTSGGAAGSGLTTGCPNNKCSGYELTKDIDLSNGYPNSPNWLPTGTFTATFDGKGYTISGLKITGNPDNAGLFSIISDASIGNLKLATVAIAGGNNVGALAGRAARTTLSNIELIGGEITVTGSNIGGLVGDFRSGTIADSTSSLTIRGGRGDNIGGLVGLLADGSIKNSNSSGYVSVSSGAYNVGGLVGQANNDTTIDNSWASGGVNTETGNNYVGGLVGLNGLIMQNGQLATNSGGAISNSWASGNISRTGSTQFFGGLVGTNSGTISNSWASGNIFNEGVRNDSAGGLVGDNIGNISNSWASGNVSGNDSVGGLIGTNQRPIRNNWASGNATGITTAVGGLVGASISISGRNYRLDDDGAGTKLADATALAMLSGASGDVATHSNWHAGFDLDNPSNTATADFDDITKYCDTNKNGNIDPTERMANNSVWVMAPTANNVTTASTDIAGVEQGYYQIPALRCIGDTKGKTTQEITDIRQREIDRQRHLFPR